MNKLKLQFTKRQIYFSDEYYFYYHEMTEQDHPIPVNKFYHKEQYAKLCQRLKINYTNE